MRFTLEFDRDALQVPYVELRIDAALPLECQRTLQRFLQPVQLVQRLGLIRDEADEAGLPEGYEPLLLPDDGMLRPAELVEDELILAVPVVPAMPGTEAMERDWPVQEEEHGTGQPVRGAGRLKKHGMTDRIVKRTTRRAAVESQSILKLEHSHGCTEVPRFPLPQGHAPRP